MSYRASDSIVVINGPEDGNAHSVAESEFTIGCSRECSVPIILDDDIRNIHAHAIREGDAFRVRAMGGATLSVNGKRVGVLRTRVLYEGDVLQAGSTKMVLQRAASNGEMDSAGIAVRIVGFFRSIAYSVYYVLRKFIVGSLSLAWRSVRWIKPFQSFRRLLLIVVLVVLFSALFPPARPLWEFFQSMFMKMVAPLSEELGTAVDEITQD